MPGRHSPFELSSLVVRKNCKRQKKNKEKLCSSHDCTLHSSCKLFTTAVQEHKKVVVRFHFGGISDGDTDSHQSGMERTLISQRATASKLHRVCNLSTPIGVLIIRERRPHRSGESPALNDLSTPAATRPPPWHGHVQRRKSVLQSRRRSSQCAHGNIPVSRPAVPSALHPRPVKQ